MNPIAASLLVGDAYGVVRGQAVAGGGDGSIGLFRLLSSADFDAICASSAVICSVGGRTGHMQSVCRARGIPVVRVAEADFEGISGAVIVDLAAGQIREDDAAWSPSGRRSPIADLRVLGEACVVVASRLDVQQVNSGEGSGASVARSFFLREEFLCLEIGADPVAALSGDRLESQRYGAAIGTAIAAYVGDLLTHQRIVARLLDLRSDDAQEISPNGLTRAEANPELGDHGARWLARSAQVPIAHAAAKRVLRENLGAEAERVSFAVPFVNDAGEFARVLRHLESSGPVEPMSAFVETPAAVHATLDFFAAGASEVFVGTKDIVQFYLAADRGNHEVADSYLTQHPAVIAALEAVIRAGRAADRPVFVYSLLSDLLCYVDGLPQPTGFMMCAGEFLDACGS